MPAPTPVPVRKTVPPGMAVTLPPRELPTVPEVAADVEVEVRSDRTKIEQWMQNPFSDDVGRRLLIYYIYIQYIYIL